MGRPPLPVGTNGTIRYAAHPSPDGNQFRASTKFRDTDGVTRPVSRIGKTRPAAKRRLLESLVDRRPPATTEIGPDTRFKVAAEAWLTEVKRIRAGTTYDTYRRTARGRVLLAVGDLQLRELTVPVIHNYLRELETELAPNTVRSCRKVLSGTMSFAVQLGAIASNPVRQAGRIEGGGDAARAMTREEREEFLLKLDMDERARRDDMPDLVRFLLGTGVRIGEALGLRWWRVDLEAKEVVVGPLLVRETGNGLVVHEGGKSRGALRIIPMPDFLYWMLCARTRAGVDPLEPVFTNTEGNWRDPNNTQRSFRKARAAAGFSWVTTHTMRKTAATILDMQGKSPREIAGHLGHSRPSMTLDVYMDRRNEGHSVSDALDAAMGPQSPDDRVK